MKPFKSFAEFLLSVKKASDSGQKVVDKRLIPIYPYWQCKCGYILTDIEMKFSRYDYYCPRCKIRHISSYHLVKQEERKP